MERMSGVVRAKLPDAGIFYNSRWGLQFEDEAEYYSQVEIESLPTGGWGYGFYPLWSRYARHFGLPMLGMTGRFHRSWADWGGLKHPAALQWECAGILATGGAISIGDQLHPRGLLNGAVYDVIGEAFADVEALEPYCEDTQPVTQVALLILESTKTRAGVGSSGGSIEGAAKILLEMHHQFDVITPTTADFGRYEAIVIADHGVASSEVVERLRTFVVLGGKLLLSNAALLDGDHFALADEMGLDVVGYAFNTPDYFEITDARLASTVTRVGFEYSLYEGPTVQVAPRAGVERLAEAHESYFNRTWDRFSSHDWTPPRDDRAGYPAVTLHGNVLYIAGPVFAAYQKHGNLTFRGLVGRCLDLLLPERVVRTDAPATTEVTLMRQAERDIVHIVNYHAGRRAPQHVEVLEEPVPLHDITIDVRRAAPTTVKLARAGTTLDHASTDGVVTVRVPRVGTHELVVFE